MRNLIVGLLIVLSLGLVSCSTYKVSAGEVGIIVDLYGTDKGLQQQVVGVGQYTLGFNQQLYTYPIYKVQYPFTANATEGSKDDESISFQNKDGVKINADFAIQAQVKEESASVLKLFVSYREDLPSIIHTQVRNRLRDYLNQFASPMSVEELYGPAKMVMIDQVQKAMDAEFGSQGLNIQNISLLGNVRFPPEIEAAITAKITATQKTLQRDNEVAQAKAEAQIAIAQAQGVAESNRILTQSLTPIMIQKMAIEKWDGHLPQVTSGATPFIALAKP